MKVIKRKSEFRTIDVIIESKYKTLSFIFGGNGDLYWIINNIEKKEETKFEYLTIYKENYYVYSLFEQLYLDIKNIDIFKRDKDYFLPYIETKEEYLKEQELEKNKIRMFNHSNYNELFNEEEKTITWYSDETAHDVANILKIKKIDDAFRIEFYTQPYIDGYDKENNLPGCIVVRFRNSGSSYDPFNIIFMRMFDSLQKIDDINDFGHQYHIEEYLYKKKTIIGIIDSELIDEVKKEEQESEKKLILNDKNK